MPDENIQREIHMMQTPRLWPNVLLPLKKRGVAGSVTGYKTDARPIVYIGNIFMASKDDESIEFPNTAAIVDSGWRVD
jgi:hypothetical protein